MALTKQALMQYCRVDDEEAGDILLSLASSAEQYLRAAGINDSGGISDRYDLAVKSLALHWFDNPAGGELPAGLRQLINQLKFGKET